MRKVLFFMFTSLNGYYDRGKPHLDWDNIDWHNFDEEMSALSNAQLNSVDVLLFGRKTYEGMASFWPTPEALADSPETAEQMNSLPKIVFSRTLDKAEWNNTRLVRDPVEEIAKLKEQPGVDVIVMGSSELAVSLGERGLIDEYRIMVNPILLAEGTPLFQGLGSDVRLELLQAKAYKNGNVLLSYEPVRS